MRKVRFGGINVPKRINESKFLDSSKSEDILKDLGQAEFHGTREQCQTKIYNVRVKVIRLFLKRFRD